MRFRGATLLAALAVLTISTGAQRATPNIVLITLDTTRADRLGAYGYKLAATPNIDRLATEGIVFTDATTHAPLTGPAHAAILTGHYPGRLGIKDNASTPIPESATTLAESLKGAGYRTGAFIGSFVVDRSYGFGQGFDTFDASFNDFRQEVKAQVQRPAGQVIDPAIAWITSGPANGATRRPFFAWIHLYDPHAPYDAPAPFKARFAARPYDGELAYVDSEIGRLLGALKQAGATDDTIVVAMADHGEALGDHGEEEHGVFLYEAVARIPWIMRLPGAARRGTTVSEQVRAVDLMPTLLELAGVNAPERSDGESLVPVIRGNARRDPPPAYLETWYPQLHFGWSRLRALRVGEWKYVDAPKPELYDLRSDRAEQRNVVAERSNVAARMASELDAIEKSFGAAATAAPPQPDAETVARLRSLGYVGLASPGARTARGPDPKDRIATMNRFKALLAQASGDLKAGRTDAAIEKLNRAVGLNELAFDAHTMLGSAWQMKKDWDKALGEYDAAALLNPVLAAPHVLAADLYLARGDYDRALERLQRASKLEPDSGEVASTRGRVLERAGRMEEALEQHQRGVTLNPHDATARGRLVATAMTLRRYDVAEPHLKILAEQKYQPARTHYALGLIAESRGDKATAATEYRRAITIDPKFTSAQDALRRVSR